MSNYRFSKPDEFLTQLRKTVKGHSPFKGKYKQKIQNHVVPTNNNFDEDEDEYDINDQLDLVKKPKNKGFARNTKIHSTDNVDGSNLQVNKPPENYKGFDLNTKIHSTDKNGGKTKKQKQKRTIRRRKNNRKTSKRV